MNDQTDPTPIPEALDTDDTRGWHFKRYLAKRWVQGLTVVLMGAAGAGAGIAAAPAIGAAAAAGALILVVVIAYAAAHAAATRDFFRNYAQQRGLTLTEGKGTMPPATGLLRKGDRRYCRHAMSGTLPGAIDGTYSRYTYEVDSTDSEGNRDTATYNFNVVLASIPESATRLQHLYVERRSGFRFLDSAEDAFRRRTERLELESEALDKRYEIFHHRDDDLVYLHELFTPAFIVWLAENAPDDFGFEYEAGALCINTKGHYDSAEEIDTLCKAAALVAERLRSEALE